ncbi:MAG: hypothetical protein JNM66_12760 [Bryobacterales bacterium]|nr:hypothetical protein [Bryobacterales bacterium]
MPKKKSQPSLLQRVVDSPAGKLPQILNAALQILIFVGGILGTSQIVGTLNQESPVPPAISVPKIRPETIEAPLLHGKMKALPSPVQTAYGVQSPNISKAKRDVLIQFDSSVMKIQEAAPKNIPPSPSAPSASSQTSYGAQSPNLSGVEGNIEIRYGTPPAGASEKRSDKN